jgi:hypothetical protein
MSVRINISLGSVCCLHACVKLDQIKLQGRKGAERLQTYPVSPTILVYGGCYVETTFPQAFSHLVLSQR